MELRFNPTGTHIHKGKLKVRIDFYPDPMDKTYTMHYVDKPDSPYPITEAEAISGIIDKKRWEAWWATVPKHKELNPCLCHFIVVNEDTALQDLGNYLIDNFDEITLKQIDDIMVRADSRFLIGAIVESKLICGTGKPILRPERINIDEINSKFTLLEVQLGH